MSEEPGASYEENQRGARRDALIGGLILVSLGTPAGVFGVWALANQHPDPGNDLSSLGRLLDQVIIVLGVILVVVGGLATPGGRRRRRFAGSVAIGFGAMFVFIAQSLWPFFLAAIPCFVSAFLLLRSGSTPTGK